MTIIPFKIPLKAEDCGVSNSFMEPVPPRPPGAPDGPTMYYCFSLYLKCTEEISMQHFYAVINVFFSFVLLYPERNWVGCFAATGKPVSRGPTEKKLNQGPEPCYATCRRTTASSINYIFIRLIRRRNTNQKLWKSARCHFKEANSSVGTAGAAAID
jgi:hypothetical protein